MIVAQGIGDTASRQDSDAITGLRFLNGVSGCLNASRRFETPFACSSPLHKLVAVVPVYVSRHLRCIVTLTAKDSFGYEFTRNPSISVATAPA